MAETEAMHLAVGQQIHDPQRAARLNQAIDGMAAELTTFRGVGKSVQGKAETLNARPDASQAEFESLLADYDSQRKTIRSRIIELHFQMISATTAEEWKKLWPYERDALTAVGF